MNKFVNNVNKCNFYRKKNAANEVSGEIMFAAIKLDFMGNRKKPDLLFLIISVFSLSRKRLK